MKNNALVRRTLMALGTAVALCSIPSVSASILIGNGYAIGSESFTLTSSTVTPAVNPLAAGGFTGTWDGNALLFWCFELDETFSFGVPYTDYVASPLSTSFPLLNAQVAELFQAAGGSIGANSSVLTSAAFQLALWEIRYETSGTFNLTGGTFMASGDATGALAIAQANTWLNNLPTSSTYSITLLHSGAPESHQDFVTDSRVPTLLLVPEPSMLPLVGVGFLGMLVALRRRGNQARWCNS